jgi:hypothetical protein
VIWTYPSTYGGLVGKKALHAAGFKLAMISSDVHPYSGTRFGKRFLNPVRTAVENHYLSERIVMFPKQEVLAMRRATELLRANTLVEITASGAADNPATFPLFGGELRLALGGPMLSIMSGAALFASFTRPVGKDRFKVVLTPIVGSEEGLRGPPRELAPKLASQYVKHLQSHVLAAPAVWRGWFSRTNWSPPHAG